MRINTNVSSLTAQDAAQNTSKSITGSLEKLSTGLRINKASDDASGLAIADKLRTQATSINQGITNGNSAVSLLQIADKSMAEQSNILDTIKAKLIQANTDTTSADGRESIRKDIVKLLEQLDNIAEQTNYNGNVLLQTSASDTNASSALAFQIGESKNDVIKNNAIQSNTNGLGGGAIAITSGGVAAATGSNVIAQGASMELKEAAGGDMVFKTAVGTATGSTAQSEKLQVSGVIQSVTIATGDMTITDVDTETAKVLDAIVAASGASGKLTGSASAGYTLASGTKLDLGSLNVSKMTLTTDATGLGGITLNSTATDTVKVKNLDKTTDGNVYITGGDIKGGDLLSSLAALTENQLTKTTADKFQNIIDNALTDLNGYRGDIGSTQNQVESAVRNLMTQATNVKAAESIIRDVDYAAESANFNKQNIISQAGAYAISQANAVQQNVLKLLQ
ncbi:MAG: flagellin [Aliarcobacter sp.]|nr:flagellin [Aliarcobacter sp.]